MNQVIHYFWQSNIEFSLLLLAIFAARYGVRHVSNNKNTYLLWMSIPAGLVVAWLLKQIEFDKPQVEAVTQIVQNYVVQPYVIEASQALNSWFFLTTSWLLIAGVLLLRLLYQHFQLRKELGKIRTAKSSTTSAKYEVVGISKTDFSPAAYGFIRPKIYFPLHLERELSKEQIKLIITHEEHHIQQGHLWLNLIWDIAVCLMWFNPLLYVARKCFRHDQELYCDYLVLHKTNTHAHSAYGHALLSTVSATHSVSLLCPWKSMHQLEERIMNIKKTNHFNNTALLTLFGAAIVACTSLYSVSAHETSNDSDKHKKVYKFVDVDLDLEKDSDEKRQVRKIKIISDGKTFVDMDGEKYVTEGDVKRDMTDEELKMFEQEIEKAQAHKMVRKSMHGGDNSEGHKQIQVIRMHEEGELSEENLEMLMHEMKNVQIEMGMHEDEFEMARHEIKMAEKDIKAARAAEQLSKPKAEKARKQLENARKRLERDQQRMEKSMQQTRAEIERLRTDIMESKPH